MEIWKYGNIPSFLPPSLPRCPLDLRSGAHGQEHFHSSVSEFNVEDASFLPEAQLLPVQTQGKKKLKNWVFLLLWFMSLPSLALFWPAAVTQCLGSGQVSEP